MNIGAMARKMYGARNRPVRCKSRWRKNLDRKNRPHKIVEASRKRPFMTIQYFPRTEEERLEIERRQFLMMAGLGTVVGPLLFRPGGIEKLEEMMKGQT